MEFFDAWGLLHSGLCTLTQSAKHIRLYAEIGIWPRYLSAVMARTPEAASAGKLTLTLGNEKTGARSGD